MVAKPLLQVRNLKKTFGNKVIFDEASVNILERQKIGVVGRNGAGKTTLFKMILGKEEPDSGEIVEMPILQLGYIEQHDPFEKEETVLEFLQRYTGKPEWECAKVASRFLLKGDKLVHPVTALSGGYQMRVKLTATLLFEPNLLLLDEPTNFLDLSTLILLENFLLTFNGAFLVITHDREFIKRTAHSILELENGQLSYHPRPLEEYLQFKQEQKETAEVVNKNIDRKQKQLQTFVDRFGSKASMAKSAQSKMKQIEKLGERKIQIDQAFSKVKMRIPRVDSKIGPALICKNLNIGYGDKKVASDISFEVGKGEKVAVLGDNGQGKSTFLKTIAGQLPPLSGKCFWKNNLQVVYYNQHVHQTMSPDRTVFDYLASVSVTGNEQDLYEMLGNFLFTREDYTKTIEVLSGGEKARLCLAGMFLSKADVYLLDEPTNHLDFQTVEAMGQALREFNGTVFLVSHDRTFVNLLATDILEVKDQRVRRISGNYEAYVWRLEQEAKSLTKSEQTQKENSKNDKPKPDKEVRKKLYELKKTQTSLERKIGKLKTTISQESENWKAQQDLEEQEDKWLQVQMEIDSLNL